MERKIEQKTKKTYNQLVANSNNPVSSPRSDIERFCRQRRVKGLRGACRGSMKARGGCSKK